MTERPPLYHLTVTRIRLFFREPGAVFWSFGFPLMLSLTLGVAFRNKPPEPVRAAVQQGPGADLLVRALNRSPDIRAELVDTEGGKQRLRAGKVAIVVVPGLPRTYAFDRTRPESRLARALVDDTLQRAAGRHDPVFVRDVVTTEPGSRYVDFLIPGLIGMNLMSSGLWGIGFVIVEMRSKRLLKRLVATPMRRRDFLLSLVLMRMVFLVVELPLVLVFAWLVFDVHIRGSLPLFIGMAALGALTFAGIGLLVASRAQNTQTVGGLINLVMLPMFLCSGVFFSSANFPDALQPFIRVLPLTALNDGLRAILNDGATAEAVAMPALILAITTLLSFVAALRLFRWSS